MSARHKRKFGVLFAPVSENPLIETPNAPGPLGGSFLSGGSSLSVPIKSEPMGALVGDTPTLHVAIGRSHKLPSEPDWQLQ